MLPMNPPMNPMALSTIVRVRWFWALSQLFFGWAAVVKTFERGVRWGAYRVIAARIRRQTRAGRPIDVRRLYRLEEFFIRRTHAAYYAASLRAFSLFAKSRFAAGIEDAHR